MSVLVVRWILKEIQSIVDILLGSGLTLTENMALGVLNYLITSFGVSVHPNILHLTKHCFQIN